MNNYADELKNNLWSHSTLTCYCTCPYQFYLKKIMKETGIGNPYSAGGKFGHSLNEEIFNGTKTIDEALSEWVDTAEYYMDGLSESSKEKKIDGFSEYLTDFDESYKETYDILGVELECRWEIDGFKFIGYIDLLLQNKESKDIILVDHKSASPFFGKKGNLLKNKEESFFTYKKQMYMYCNYVKEKFGSYPKLIVWNHFFDNQATIIDFEIKDLAETNEWAVNTIKQILNDETFEANKSFFMCNKLCDYREECEYLLEDEED